jgi:hypothetical protein
VSGSAILALRCLYLCQVDLPDFLDQLRRCSLVNPTLLGNVLKVLPSFVTDSIAVKEQHRQSTQAIEACSDSEPATAFDYTDFELYHPDLDWSPPPSA